MFFLKIFHPKIKSVQKGLKCQKKLYSMSNLAPVPQQWYRCHHECTGAVKSASYQKSVYILVCRNIEAFVAVTKFNFKKFTPLRCVSFLKSQSQVSWLCVSCIYCKSGYILLCHNIEAFIAVKKFTFKIFTPLRCVLLLKSKSKV